MWSWEQQGERWKKVNYLRTTQKVSSDDQFLRPNDRAWVMKS